MTAPTVDPVPAQAPATEPGPPPLLELTGIRASYGRIEVLHGIDLVVPRGEVVALLGPNGAGKSTTLLVATGQHPASAGCVHVAGRHVNGAKPEDLARIGLCTIPEGRGVFRNLTVRENLRMASYRGLPERDIIDRAVARFPRLGERIGQVAGTLSGGEQQMLAMARGLATDPALLIIDELSMGLAPLIVAELYELVAGIAQEGVSILVVEQFARTVLGVADRAVIMQHGNVIAAGVPADLEAELSAAYLGAQS
ncbi:ABC transporter ATP-binding protein [Aquihabitans sp. G128]|uniref:ABC transporter ATP-binding protein n=1 Tax=Aquihabitans sp. G128 TaxID=2849779 RepID=UPI001C23DDE1|nr:ABC transporter ATP-binding protein [Aquihabitans sp. G128]QXC62928.1 ABC transporter ATP-binding protein [Aquihabitans sp. G128]